MEQHNEQIRARITGTGNLLREIFACLFPVLGTLYAFSHAAVVLYLCAGVTGGYLPFGTCVPQPICRCLLSGCTWQLLSKRRAVPVFERR